MYLWSLLLIYVCMMHVCMMHIWYLVLDPGPWCLYIWCMYIWCMYVWCMYAWSLYDAQMYDTHISDPDPWSWYMHASMMHISVMYAWMYDPCMMHKCMIHIFLILIPDPYTWMYPWCIYLWCSIFCHERTNGPTNKAILGVGWDHSNNDTYILLKKLLQQNLQLNIMWCLHYTTHIQVPIHTCKCNA